MNNHAYFVTGTDTNVGKTYVTTHLLRLFQNQGLHSVGLKPIASGATDELVNDDALQLQKASSIALPLSDINPFVFKEPIAPHLAAKKKGLRLSVSHIKQRIIDTITQYPADRYLIEGAGGLYVPLNEHETLIDLIAQLHFPIVLVVGIRLGCINHALLTTQVIESYQLPFAGWIANCLDQTCEEKDDIIETLTERITAPCLMTL